MKLQIMKERKKERKTQKRKNIFRARSPHYVYNNIIAHEHNDDNG